MARRFARENFTSGRRRRLISSSMLKPPIVAERLAERHTPHSWTSFGGFQSFHFRYGSNTCLRRIEVWHRAYPICDAPGFRVRRGQPSLSFRNRGVITVLTCEQNCPIRYGFRASTPPPSGGCMAYFSPHVRWHESSFILHAGSMPVVGSSCLDKLVMNRWQQDATKTSYLARLCVSSKYVVWLHVHLFLRFWAFSCMSNNNNGN